MNLLSLRLIFTVGAHNPLDIVLCICLTLALRALHLSDVDCVTTH